ncbi:MAG: hypothetical protein HOF22_11575 [Verrucomicrobia bacterium]|nr:hypothetical protein [Verrucomicrobiota bacterium]
MFFVRKQYVWLPTLRYIGWFAMVALLGQVPGQAELVRKANTTFIYPNNPQLFDYHSRNALPGITFEKPICIRASEANGGELFVAEQTGRVWRVTNLSAQPVKSLFLDLSARVYHKSESGFLGFELHPQFEKNGFVYVFYTYLTTTGSNDGMHDQLSRFRFKGKVGSAIDIKTEAAMFTQFDQHTDHNGGDLHFGPDGYLYVSLGDEGGGYDQYGNSQRIDNDYFGGILRIDVDQRSGNLKPAPHAGLHGNYLVPSDNPFVGAKTFAGGPVDAAKLRSEFWAVGLRNPWRMAFDPDTGKLYTGDTGDHVREEINLIERGGNYGYPVFEGTPEGPRFDPTAKRDDYIFPEAEYGRSYGNDVAGFLFYRGDRPASLDGHIVFSDFSSGWIGAVDFRSNADDQRPIRCLFWDDNISTLGTHPLTGDILLADWREGTIKKIITGRDPDATPLPEKLSDLGLFRNLATLEPHDGIVPYEVATPLWSDGAHKRRWFSVANLQSKIHFNAYKPWSFPGGAAWVKHFELDVIEDGLAKRKRLETRILYRTPWYWYGTTYRWNDAQTDATLVPPDGESEELTIRDGDGLAKLVWSYPSRRECLSCHNYKSRGALGFYTAQLNRPIDYGDGTENQLEALSRAGYLDREITDPHTYPALAPLDDETKSLEFRAVSYIEANCANCHRPHLTGIAQTLFDARTETPISFSHLIGGKPHNDFGDGRRRFIHPGEPDLSVVYNRMATPGLHRMPPLASSLPDDAAVDLMAEWIRSVGGNHFAGNAAADADGDGHTNYTEFLLGTDAGDAGDKTVPFVRISETRSEIEFVLPANRDVTVFASDSLGSGTWHPVEGVQFDRYSNNRQIIRVREALGQQRFYRVEIREP